MQLSSVLHNLNWYAAYIMFTYLEIEASSNIIWKSNGVEKLKWLLV